MKTVKTIVLVLTLGMFGYVYADQVSQSSTASAEKAAKSCKMCSADASCCKPGADCCKEGADCCKQECCSEESCCAGDSCCKPGAECCKAGAECCDAGSGCCAKMTANADQKGHTAKEHKDHAAKGKAGCCKATDDSKADAAKSGCGAGSCCIARATKN